MSECRRAYLVLALVGPGAMPRATVVDGRAARPHADPADLQLVGWVVDACNEPRVRTYTRIPCAAGSIYR